MKYLKYKQFVKECENCAYCVDRTLDFLLINVYSIGPILTDFGRIVVDVGARNWDEANDSLLSGLAREYEVSRSYVRKSLKKWGNWPLEFKIRNDRVQSPGLIEISDKFY